jgi:hypothetical protein
LRRHEDKLVTKWGEKFALNRSDWTTLPNIKQMNEVIYDEMVDATIAVALDTPVFTDINGKSEDHKTKRFGLAQPIKITKPEWILFADESRFNTSQKKRACWWSEICPQKRNSPADNVINNGSQIYLAPIHFRIWRSSVLRNNLPGKRGCPIHLEDWC